jgi:hypothetical protein
MPNEVTGENLWGEINIDHWNTTPHIKNRIATEDDVVAGIAVFYVGDAQSNEHIPLDINIPSLAYQKDEGNNEEVLVVVIQGEKIGDDELVGVRYLNGGNGMC